MSPFFHFNFHKIVQGVWTASNLRLIMASKDSNPLPIKSQTMSPAMKESIATTTVTPPKTASSTDQGLADLTASPPKEAGKRQEILQKAQLEPTSAVKEVKEKTSPSPTTRTIIMPLRCGLRWRLVQETLRLPKRSRIVLTLFSTL